MDTGKGKFVQLTEEETKLELERRRNEALQVPPDERLKHGGIFRAGEILEIRGSRFLIHTITGHFLKLKLLPQQKG